MVKESRPRQIKVVQVIVTQDAILDAETEGYEWDYETDEDDKIVIGDDNLPVKVYSKKHTVTTMRKEHMKEGAMNIKEFYILPNGRLYAVIDDRHRGSKKET